MGHHPVHNATAVSEGLRARRLGQHVPTGWRWRHRWRRRWRRRLRIVGIVEVVVLLLRRLQEAVGCIFSCTALAMHFPLPISCSSFRPQNGVGSAHLLFKMVAVHFDFCLFFSLLPLLLAALFALSLLFCKELQQQGSRGEGAVCSRCSYIQHTYIYSYTAAHAHLCM